MTVQELREHLAGLDDHAEVSLMVTEFAWDESGTVYATGLHGGPLTDVQTSEGFVTLSDKGIDD